MTPRGGWGPVLGAERAGSWGAAGGEAEGARQGRREGRAEWWRAPGKGAGELGVGAEGAQERERGCGGRVELRLRGGRTQAARAGRSAELRRPRWVSARAAAGLGTRLRAPPPRLGLWLRGARAAGKSNLPEAATSHATRGGPLAGSVSAGGRPQGPGRGRGRGLRASVWPERVNLCVCACGGRGDAVPDAGSLGGDS